MIFDIVYRIWYGFINQPKSKKKDDAIRFGLLGASNIAYVLEYHFPPPAKMQGQVLIILLAQLH